MENVAKLILNIEPSAQKIDDLKDSLKRLGAAMDELRATGTLDITLDLTMKTQPESKKIN